MEPVTLTAAATAIATLVLTKALEKTGEKLGEKVFDKGGKLMGVLKDKLPRTATAIELAEPERLDWGEAVLDVESAAKTDPEIAEAVMNLEAAAKEDSNPKLTQTVQEVENTLKSQQPTIQNLGKLAETIKGVVNQGVINNQTINQTII